MKDQDIYLEDSIKTKEEFDFKKWVGKVFRMWYWFVGSLAISIFVGWLYLHYTNPSFRSVASVMIKDEKKGGDLSENAILKDLGIGGSKLVENEIEILRSYDLMEEVVKSEQLFISYNVEGRLRDVPLFGAEVPFEIEILNVDSMPPSTKWMIALEQGKAKFIKEKKQTQAIEYGQEYFIDGLRFRLMPNIGWRALHTRDTLANGVYNITVVSLAIATTDFNKRLGIDPIGKQTSVVGLSINDGHKEKGRTVLATLIDIYNRQGLDDKNKVTANTIDFLNDRLKAVALDLQGVEGQVQRFKTANQITDISTDAQQYMEIAKGIDMQKAESQTRLNIIAAMERDLIINQNSPGLVPSTLGIQEVSLASLVEKHNTLVLERERLEKNKEIGPQNPLIVDVRQQVQETRRTLLSNVQNLKNAYQIALNDILRKDEQLKARIQSVPQIEQKLVEIQRNRNVEEQLYAFLLQKREEAAVTLASNIPDSRTITKARILGAISPTPKVVWALSVIIGLLIPLTLLIVRDFLNNKVGEISEIQQKSRAPLLGVISYIKRLKEPIVITLKARSIVAEQIRTLRTAIGFTGKGTAVKKILITSSQPGDGKSFVSINVAASYALLGKKTVIVELDLRKPHVGKYLNIANKKGITNILAGKANLNETLVEVEGFEGNLHLLSAGHLPPNPAELISSSNMEKLVQELEQRFDYIIIDTPPFGLVTDAVLLQRFADITLVVLRQSHTNKAVYAEVNERLAQKPDYPLYLVLNGIGWQRRYQEGYGYGKYGYRYGKGYYTED